MAERVDEEGILSKVRGVPRAAGREVVRQAVVLWCLLKDENTPAWAKGLIVGALVYFVSPIDAIPDFLPGGFVDDVAAMALCLSQVEAHRTPGVDGEAERLMPDWCRKEP